jgi:hypothetical protein
MFVKGNSPGRLTENAKFFVFNEKIVTGGGPPMLLT